MKANAGESSSTKSDANLQSNNGDHPTAPPRPPQKQSSTRFDYSIFGDSRKKPVAGDRESLRAPPSVPSSHESETGWGAVDESGTGVHKATIDSKAAKQSL